MSLKYAPRPRTPPKLSAEQLVSGLIFHQLHDGGTLADHSGQLHGVSMSDSAYAQRRQLLPEELFDEIMLTALQLWPRRASSRNVFHSHYRSEGLVFVNASHYHLIAD